MKKLILVLFISLMSLSVCNAGMIIQTVASGSCAAGSTGGSLLSESFDTGLGYDDVWTEPNETDPDPDYTTNPPVTATPFCTESFHFSGSDEWAQNDFGSNNAHVYISFDFYFNSESLGAAEKVQTNYLRTTGTATVVEFYIYDDANDGDLDIHFITKTVDRGTLGDLALSTIYKMRIELYNNGTSDTANCYVYNSSDVLVDSVTLSGADYLDNDIGQILLGAITGTGSVNMVIDNLQVDTSGYIN